MNAKIIRPFIPSIDFEISKSFYQELGFKITYEEEKMVILTLGEVSFFLQDAYVQDWAENTMIQLFVDDLEGLYEIAVGLSEKYENIRLKEIHTPHYGKTFHLIGPAGVLWHMMEYK
jgi:hypothetical protein